MVGAHTHTDVALGEGKKQGGLWLAAGLESEFPLWLGLISSHLPFWVTHVGLSPFWTEGYRGKRYYSVGEEGVEAGADCMGHKGLCPASKARCTSGSWLCSVVSSVHEASSCAQYLPQEM